MTAGPGRSPDDRAASGWSAPALNPAQQQVIERLGSRPSEHPEFAPDLRDDLRRDIEAELAGALGPLPEGTSVFVSKHHLSVVHQCEARWLAEQDVPFVPSVATVRGTVAHKAVELGIAWHGDPNPLELVDEALASLTEGDDRWVGDFLRGASERERAEVRAQANERVAAFLDCWPPLERRWRPVPEARQRADLAGGRVVVQGRVDLVLGRSEGRRAGKVLVDFKTGAWSPAHHEDLRLYALVETLRLGVPPRRLATSYLDSGELRTEDVTVAALEAAGARLVDGVARMVAVRHGGAPASRRPSAACRWCPASATCAEGQAFLAEAGWARPGGDPGVDKPGVDDEDDSVDSVDSVEPDEDRVRGGFAAGTSDEVGAASDLAPRA
ncbi:MAG: PD-(D/E)XK nuclease family protein [Actinobacteria bacterium]|nr:PD-(D/E)XK nuclease family protein [Actinomycetota bacterium]